MQCIFKKFITFEDCFVCIYDKKSTQERYILISAQLQNINKNRFWKQSIFLIIRQIRWLIDWTVRKEQDGVVARDCEVSQIFTSRRIRAVQNAALSGGSNYRRRIAIGGHRCCFDCENPSKCPSLLHPGKDSIGPLAGAPSLRRDLVIRST